MPKRWRIAAASSSAWVGCSLVPSPALITGASMITRDRGRGAILAVADDERVGTHRVQGARRVLERFALLDRRLLDRKRDRGRAEPVRRGRERHQGARRIFVEEIEDDPALEAADRLRRPVRGAPARGRGFGRSGRRSGLSIESRSTSASPNPRRANWPARRSRLAGCGRRPARRLSRRGGRG